MPLQIQVTQDVKNPLLHRRELKIVIDHPDTGTPTRTTVRDQVAAQLTQDKASVYVITLVTRSGTRKTFGRIHVYDEPRYGLRLERPFIHLRNNPKPKAEAEQSGEAAEAAPEAEAKAPKEAKPEKEAKPAKEAKPEKEAKPAKEAKPEKEAKPAKEKKPKESE